MAEFQTSENYMHGPRSAIDLIENHQLCRLLPLTVFFCSLYRFSFYTVLGVFLYCQYVGIKKKEVCIVDRFPLKSMGSNLDLFLNTTKTFIDINRYHRNEWHSQCFAIY